LETKLALVRIPALLLLLGASTLSMLAPGCRGGAAKAGPQAGSARVAVPAGEADGSGAKAAAVAGTGSPAVEGEEATVRTGSLEDVFLLTGELRAVQSLDIATPRSEAWNVQIKWLAEDGTTVREGDRIVEFDNNSVAQGIEEKRLRVIESEIDLSSRRAALDAERVERRYSLESARSSLEKARLEAAVPPDLRALREWQEKQAALRSAEAGEEKARLELEAFEISAKADLEILRIAHDKAVRDLASTEQDLRALAIVAPRDGILVINENWREERKFQIGDMAWPGVSAASIPDLSRMEVTALLAEVDEGRIARGMRVRCTLDTHPDHIFEGSVEDVASIADEPGWRTKGGFRVRISLDRSDPSLMRPGMSVRAEVIRRIWQRVLTIPRQAVRREEGRAVVARAGEGDLVEVKLAACTPTECVVESGLAEGDRVSLR